MTRSRDAPRADQSRVRFLTPTCSAGTSSTAAIASRASAPCRTSAFDQLLWPFGAISVKNPPNPNYISNSLWGVLRDPALRGLLRFPEVGEEAGQFFRSQREGFPPGLFARLQCLCQPPIARQLPPGHQLVNRAGAGADLSNTQGRRPWAIRRSRLLRTRRAGSLRPSLFFLRP